MAGKRSKSSKGSKAKPGTGKRFKALAGPVEQEYEDKGYSKTRAEKIGAAVAAKQGRKKYGKKRFQKMAAKGRKKK